MTAISQPANWSGYTTLATPTSQAGYISIADLTGATISGTKINNRYIMLGLSEYSTANLTEDAQKLIQNSVYYILGMDIPTGVVKTEEGRGKMEEGGFYNLYGQGVSEDYKGMKIMNGKKILK